MTEYIERDKVLAFAYWADEGHIRYGVVDIDDIENIPAADVVPVVRCKDCKYSSDFDDFVYLCNLRMIGLVHSESFCSFGVREE